jgi:hypothetical protein
VRDAEVAAAVVTVTVDVPEPFATEVGLSEHAGGRITTGVTAQLKFTALLNPLTGAIVIVDVAIPPAVTEAGVSAEAAIVKSATGAAVTVKVTVVLWFTDPAPATVMV